MRWPRLFGSLLAKVTATGTSVEKASTAVGSLPPAMYPVVGWWPRVMESFTGAWQQNVVVDRAAVAANWAVFSCITLIANDIAKMPAVVMQLDIVQKIWLATLQRPVLRRPNSYQTWPDFIRSWVFSLLLTGNTYVLKERNKDRFIIAMYVLDPARVRVLVTPAGDIYYQIGADNLAGLEEEQRIAPASEVIHDRINALYHPLLGLSPIFASGTAAMQSLAIQNNSAKFFQNMSRPSGMLTAPGPIATDTANRLKAQFETNFGGENIGRLFVAGDGLKYDAMTITAVDAQLIEQLKFTGEMVCATMHVPPYKLGLGPMPTVNNTAALNQQYYDQCLHPIVDGIERRLDIGLELEFPFETWFDTRELLRMDPSTRFASHGQAIAAGWLAVNEARREENREPVEGGETPFMQQQYWPIDQLAKRDIAATMPTIGAPPPGGMPLDPNAAANADPNAPPEDEDMTNEDATKAVTAELQRLLTGLAA